MINKEALYIIRPKSISSRLQLMLNSLIDGLQYINIYKSDDIPDLKNKKIVLALDLDEAGFCLPVFQIISSLYNRGNDSLSGSKAVIIVNSPNNLNTKSTSSNIIFLLNQLGCSFPGHPLVEATRSLSNFLTWQKTMELTLEEICLYMCRKLQDQLLIDTTGAADTKPYIVALHASHQKTSNTLALWNITKQHLYTCDIEELHVENGKVLDCKGCSFKTCTYFSEQSSCFYGGMMVEEIFPAIEKADAVIWICPNYNDSISANLTAVINRLTALYRKTSFHNKALFAVIVSGNSGSDSVAKQLIDSLCINKGFSLPPYFTLMETANDPGAIRSISYIEENAKTFSNNILKHLKNR